MSGLEDLVDEQRLRSNLAIRAEILKRLKKMLSPQTYDMLTRELVPVGDHWHLPWRDITVSIEKPSYNRRWVYLCVVSKDIPKDIISYILLRDTNVGSEAELLHWLSVNGKKAT